MANPEHCNNHTQLENEKYQQEDLAQHMQASQNGTASKRQSRASSSDEDEQLAKNYQLFVTLRKRDPEEQIIQRIEKCLNSGAEINALNKRGKSVLDIASDKNYKNLCTFLLSRGGKKAKNLADISNNDFYVQHHNEVSSTNLREEMQTASLGVVGKNKEELDELLLADGKKYLTENKLKKLNAILQSGLDTQTVIDSLIRCEININYQDFKTKQFAIDIAWENAYECYETMLVLLEAGSKFPADFTLDALYQDTDIPEKLKTFVREREKLHQWIKNNELEKIKKYIDDHQLSNFLSSENKSALETAAEYANVKTVETLIALQLPLKNISKDQCKLLEQVDAVGNTLLSIAAKSGKKDNVDFFISCGIDINHRNKSKKSAIDLAWDNRCYDVVLTLLKADSDFPNDFYLDGLNKENAQKELNQFVEERDNLHKIIKENRSEDIKKDFPAFDISKYYLNSESESALSAAIKSKHYEIFAFLKSKGIMFKNKDEEKYIDNLSEGEKHTLKTAMIREFPQVDKGHIFYLISKSRSQKPIENFNDRIKNLYMSLDDIPEVSIILQVIQYTDYLDIVFDFDHENIKNINPTASEATRGTTDYKNGTIYVAAKMEENNLSGTLAHELTHLAMYILYKNDCNPFDKSENSNSRSFAEITAKIEEITKEVVQEISGNENSPVVTLAGAFKYPQNEHQCELIVRVPHILAQFPGEGREWFDQRKEFKLLIDYFNDRSEGGVAYRCNEFIENSFLIKPRNSIQFFNANLGVNDIFKKYRIHFEEPIDLDDFLKSKSQVFLVKTESTLLSMLSIYETLIIRNKSYSLQDSLFAAFNAYIEKQDEINKLLYSPAGKVLCISYPDDSIKETLLDVLKNLKKLLDLKSDKKVIFIVQESETKSFHEITSMFKGNCEQAPQHKFTLNNLTKESQQKLLELEIKLQERNTNLNKLIDISDSNAKKVINTQALVKLIQGETIEIGRRPPDTSDLEGAYSELYKEVNMGTFVAKLLSQELRDVYIISGIPGSDKQESLVSYLNSNIEDISQISKVNDLESQIEVLNQHDGTRGINKRIQVADDKFSEKKFKQICHNNPAMNIYWIHLKNEVNESKFILQQIYNPDFYLAGKRFNNEVVIEKNVVKELGSVLLTEIFIIRVKFKNEVTRWLEFKDDQERQFEINCQNNKIQFVTSQDNMEDYFPGRFNANTVHLLEFNQNQLIWYKTYGSFKSLHKYRAKDHKNIQPLIEEHYVIKEIQGKKVSIIAGNPGTGKSTTMAQLYNAKYASQSGQEDSIMKSHWVITVNLKDHLQAIRDIKFNDSDPDDSTIISEITEFLLQVQINLSDDLTKVFAKGLLGIALRKKNFEKPLLIAFDGFDEVLDKADRNKTIQLLQYFKDKTEAKIWITTRLHYEEDLVGALSTFAIKLEPMDDPTIRKFIRKSFSTRLSLVLGQDKYTDIFGNNGKEMLKYTDAFLSNMQEVFKGDVSKFIGTPLQLYLMLENSEAAGHFKKWILDANGQEADFSYLGNDIWEVYEHFVDRKYDIFCKKTGIKEQIRQKQDKVHFDNHHEALAEFLIISRQSAEESFKTIQDIVLSAGIIRSDGNNFVFIHPTFAEYFAAKVFIKWIGKWKEGNQYALMNFQKQKYFCNKILIDLDYQVIRAFLNTKLLKERIGKVQLNKEYDHTEILLKAAEENHVGIAMFVFDNFEGADVNAADHKGRPVLHVATESGNLEMVKFLVEKGANANVEDRQGKSVLHSAAISDNLEIVKFLVEKGSNFNAASEWGGTVLHSAAESGNLEIVKFLVEKGGDFNAVDNEGTTVLHNAAESGNLEIVKFLVEKGSDFNAASKWGGTVLHSAAISDSLEIVKFLVEKGSDLNAATIWGGTVLHSAAESGILGIVKFLVEKGGDLNAVSNEGTTVLHRAAKSGNLEIVKFLVENGAEDKTASKSGMTALHSAAISGNLEIVKFLVEKGSDFNAVDKFGTTVLLSAATFGNSEIVKFLIENGTEDKAASKSGMTVLHSAALSGNLEIVKFLVEKGSDFNAVDNEGSTVLLSAVKSRNLEIVKFIVENGGNFNTADNKGTTVLHDAAKFGNLEIVKFLVEKGGDFNAVDNEGTTILHIAAKFGNWEIVKYLVEKSGEFNAVHNEGTTVLHNAAESGNLGIVKFLVENGAEVKSASKSGITVLHSAAISDNLEIVKFLVENGSDFNAVNKFGLTVLHIAAIRGNLRIVKFLVEKGGNFNATDSRGSTVLHSAGKFGNLDIVKFLVDKGGDLNAVDNEGMTVLHNAAESGYLEIVKFLVEKGGDFNAEDNEGTTVLHYAAKFGYLKIVKFLVEKGGDFNAADSRGRTVLQIAEKSGFLEIINFLQRANEHQ